MPRTRGSVSDEELIKDGRSASLRGYMAEVKSVAEDVAQRVKDGEDEEDALHEAVDQSLTYTVDAYDTLNNTSHDDAYFEETGERSVEGNDTAKIVTTLAFYAKMADVREELEELLEEEDESEDEED